MTQNRIKLPLLILLGLLFIYPILAYADPTTIEEGVSNLALTIKSGSALAISVAVIQVVIFLSKRLEVFSSTIKKYGKVVVLVLSSVLTVLLSLVSGLSAGEALLVFAGSNGTAFINDLLHEIGVLKHKTV
jgi:hypothetical protein